MCGFTDFSVELHGRVQMPTHEPYWSSSELRSLQELGLEQPERVAEIIYKNKHRQLREQEWPVLGHQQDVMMLRPASGEGKEAGRGQKAPGAGVLG